MGIDDLNQQVQAEDCNYVPTIIIVSLIAVEKLT